MPRPWAIGIDWRSRAPKCCPRLLVLFAFLTWIYRFTLFLGIAVIVYHFAVKILRNRFKSAIEKSLFHIAQNDAVPSPRKHVRNSVPHRAGAQHRHSLDGIDRQENPRSKLAVESLQMKTAERKR